MKLTIIVSISLLLAGCGLFSHTNDPLDGDSERKANANLMLNHDIDRGENGNAKSLVILSLSGGGSRSAYWSAEVMMQLENVFEEGPNILKEVDVISAVSGGSLPAAYYALSKDLDDEIGLYDRVWEKNTVRDLMSNNYRMRWFGNWFLPENFLKYWFTSYDRSDIMAQTFADNLFDEEYRGFDLTFADLNPERPNIILNSTNGVQPNFGKVFTFTHEDFSKIGSDLDSYEISRAVMASSSFPAVFNYMTLKTHCDIYRQNKISSRGDVTCEFDDDDICTCDKQADKDHKYIHVFDGGNSDNLGLQSVSKILKDNDLSGYSNVIVILVDAYTNSDGVKGSERDVRGFFDFAVDFNFIDSTDSLLALNRGKSINDLLGVMGEIKNDNSEKNLILYHLEFDNVGDVDLRDQLHSIKTDFRIEDDDQEYIRKAARYLIVKENVCLRYIGQFIRGDISGGKPEGIYCTWIRNEFEDSVAEININKLE